MSDHRRIQRTLFRMTMDAGFRAELLRGGRAALESTGLRAEDLALLRGADPAGLSADPGGKRRAQALANLASEFPTFQARAASSGADELLEGFPGSAEFHDAVRTDGSLPLAFGAYAERAARGLGDPAAPALLALELAMARLRRAPASEEAPPPGAVALSDRAAIVELPAGTLELASTLRAALDSGEPAIQAPTPGPARETVLLLAKEAAGRGVSAGTVVTAERLEPPADELLRRIARAPLHAGERAEVERVARELGAPPGELEAFLAELVAEGTLIPGKARS